MKKVTVILCVACLLLPLGEAMAKGNGKPGGGDAGGGIMSDLNIWVGFYSGTDGMEEAMPHDDPASYDEFDNHLFGAGWNHWQDNTLDEIPRPCYLTGVGANPPSGGRYDCFEDASNNDYWPHGGRISIDLEPLNDTWEVVPSRKKRAYEQDFCDLMNASESAAFDDGYLRFGATRYSIHFQDGCVATKCNISVGMASYAGDTTHGYVALHPFHDLPDLADIGRISVSATLNGGDVSFLLAENELNVFTVVQELSVTGLRISFESLANGAVVAECKTQSPAVQDITFVTSPFE